MFLEPDFIICIQTTGRSTGFSSRRTAPATTCSETRSGHHAEAVGRAGAVHHAAGREHPLRCQLEAGGQGLRRQEPIFEVAPMGGGTAESIANQTLVRAEERLALTVVRPEAMARSPAV